MKRRAREREILSTGTGEGTVASEPGLLKIEEQGRKDARRNVRMFLVLRLVRVCMAMMRTNALARV